MYAVFLYPNVWMTIAKNLKSVAFSRCALALAWSRHIKCKASGFRQSKTIPTDHFPKSDVQLCMYSCLLLCDYDVQLEESTRCNRSIHGPQLPKSRWRSATRWRRSASSRCRRSSSRRARRARRCSASRRRSRCSWTSCRPPPTCPCPPASPPAGSRASSCSGEPPPVTWVLPTSCESLSFKYL